MELHIPVNMIIWEDNSSKIAKIKNILGIYMIFLLEELMLYLDDMNLSVMLSDLS